jgi:hypothetical protein
MRAEVRHADSLSVLSANLVERPEVGILLGRAFMTLRAGSRLLNHGEYRHIEAQSGAFSLAAWTLLRL